jgi:hypothetical protein
VRRTGIDRRSCSGTAYGFPRWTSSAVSGRSAASTHVGLYSTHSAAYLEYNLNHLSPFWMSRRHAVSSDSRVRRCAAAIDIAAFIGDGIGSRQAEVKGSRVIDEARSARTLRWTATPPRDQRLAWTM